VNRLVRKMALLVERSWLKWRTASQRSSPSALGQSISLMSASACLPESICDYGVRNFERFCPVAVEPDMLPSPMPLRAHQSSEVVRESS
jgi:hypothetical protein